MSRAGMRTKVPQHEVVITRPFYMGVHDVTVGQFKAFVKAKGYQTEAEKGGGALRLFPDGFWKNVPQANWQNPGFEQSDDHPVVCVSWNDAKAFCDWLSDKEGKKYALPTEAQWEYACRAGSSTKFSFGDDDRELGQYAWYMRTRRTRRTRSARRSRMPGACTIWRGTSPSGPPTGMRPITIRIAPRRIRPAPATGAIGTRVLRGGNWWLGVRESRAAYRNGAFWLPWQAAPASAFASSFCRKSSVESCSARRSVCAPGRRSFRDIADSSPTDWRPEKGRESLSLSVRRVPHRAHPQSL